MFGIHLKEVNILFVFYSIVLSTVYIRPIRKIGCLLKILGGVTGVLRYLIVERILWKYTRVRTGLKGT